MRSKSWNLDLEKCFDSSRSSTRSVFACSAGRKLCIIVQGVWAAISSGEKRWRVRPFLVSGRCWGWFFAGALGWVLWVICGSSDVWIPAEAKPGAGLGTGASNGRFFVLVVLMDWVLVVEIVDEAAATEPPHETRVSSKSSWVISGNTDRSNANFTSVGSSSDVDVSGGGEGGGSDGCWASRGLFLETKASIDRAAGLYGTPSGEEWMVLGCGSELCVEEEQEEKREEDRKCYQHVIDIIMANQRQVSILDQRTLIAVSQENKKACIIIQIKS